MFSTTCNKDLVLYVYYIGKTWSVEKEDISVTNLEPMPKKYESLDYH